MLTGVFGMRFFTAGFLEAWEGRFGVLGCEGAVVPVEAVWGVGGVELVEALLERGAGMVGEREVGLEALYRAVGEGRGEVVRVLVEAGVKPDMESLRLAVRGGDLGVCRLLVEKGADVGVGVWKEALGLGEGGKMAVAWLLERGVPPGEVLGELSLRWGG